MQIGELFLNLGVKGADQTGKALGGVKTALGEVGSMSLEAKAGIIAVVYGLERLMSASMQQGTALSNFNALTGLSAQNLQKWQYAARQAGVSSEEFTGSLKGVQASMTNMLLGKGAPEGVMLANKVGFDPKRARDTFYVMEQLQKFAKTVPPDVGNAMIKSFGVSEGTIAAMRKGSFSKDNFNKAPIYNEAEVNQLNKVDVAWGNLGDKIQKAMGHLNAKHGLSLINDLSKLTSEAMKLVDAFMKLSEAMHVFEKIGKIFEGLTSVFSGLNEIASGHITMSDVGAAINGVISGVSDELTGDQHAFFHDDSKDMKKIAAPKMGASVGKNSTQNINVNQNLNFQHDGKDAKKTGDSVHKAIKDAYRQMPAQVQGP